MFTHALGAKLSKSKKALNCWVLERAEKLNNFGSSEATFQTFNGATPGLILSKPKSDTKGVKQFSNLKKYILGKSFWSWKILLGKSLQFHASIFTPLPS